MADWICLPEALSNADFILGTGDSMSTMRAIKLALDPENRMNPGKILRI